MSVREIFLSKYIIIFIEVVHLSVHPKRKVSLMEVEDSILGFLPLQFFQETQGAN